MNIICNECRRLVEHTNPEIIVEEELTFCDAHCKRAFYEEVALFQAESKDFVNSMISLMLFGKTSPN